MVVGPTCKWGLFHWFKQDERMKQTILITGGAGYIGSHVGLFIHQSGHNVIALDKLLYGQPFNLPWAHCNIGDCGDRELLSRIFSEFSIDLVIHCAALTNVTHSTVDPLAC